MNQVKGYGDLSNVKLNSPKKIDYTIEELDKSGMGHILQSGQAGTSPIEARNSLIDVKNQFISPHSSKVSGLNIPLKSLTPANTDIVPKSSRVSGPRERLLDD